MPRLLEMDFDPATPPQPPPYRTSPMPLKEAAWRAQRISEELLKEKGRLIAENDRLRAAVRPPKPVPAQVAPKDDSKYLSPRKAARYLDIEDSTFRKAARWIPVQPGTGRYRREDLDAYAQGKRLKEKRPRLRGSDKKPKSDKRVK